MPALSGSYDLRLMECADVSGAATARVGLVRIGAGTRSPASGFRTSARHEIAFLLAGSVRVDLPDGTSRVVARGSTIVSSPTEDHATTALEDSEIFFVLVDPAAG